MGGGGGGGGGGSARDQRSLAHRAPHACVGGAEEPPVDALEMKAVAAPGMCMYRWVLSSHWSNLEVESGGRT